MILLNKARIVQNNVREDEHRKQKQKQTNKKTSSVIGSHSMFLGFEPFLFLSTYTIAFITSVNLLYNEYMCLHSACSVLGL